MPQLWSMIGCNRSSPVENASNFIGLKAQEGTKQGSLHQ
jgi:hypothetical protein